MKDLNEFYKLKAKCEMFPDVANCIKPINKSPDYIEFVSVNYVSEAFTTNSYERLIHLDPSKIGHAKLGKVIKTLLRDKKYSTDIIVKYSNKQL